MLTALLGLMIFRESLPGLWWVGAGLLVVGNVIIGRRDEEDGGKGTTAEAGAGDAYRDADGDEVDRGDDLELETEGEGEGEEEDGLK